MAKRKKSGSSKSSDFMTLHKAVGAVSRMAALLQLRGKERDASSLADALGFSPSLLSNHLKVLLQAGLVERRKAGSNRYYRLSKATSITSKGAGVELRASASDGSTFSAYIPSAAAVKQLLKSR
jgi:DNA-binding transcriptional ArsR family regulator